MDKSKLFREQNQQNCHVAMCAYCAYQEFSLRFNSTANFFQTPVVSNDCDPTRAARILFFFFQKTMIFFWKTCFKEKYFYVGLPTSTVALAPVACSGNKENWRRLPRDTDPGSVLIHFTLWIGGNQELVGWYLNLLPLPGLWWYGILPWRWRKQREMTIESYTFLDHSGPGFTLATHMTILVGVLATVSSRADADFRGYNVKNILGDYHCLCWEINYNKLLIEIYPLEKAVQGLRDSSKRVRLYTPIYPSIKLKSESQKYRIILCWNFY